jgi:hypothetical protein
MKIEEAKAPESTATKNTHFKFVIMVSSVAAFGGLLFGYDTAVIAGAIGFLQTKFELTAAMTGWAASGAIWGCILGVVSAGYMSDAIGRKKVLILSATLFAISAIGSAIPQNLTQFVMARFIGGVGVGAADAEVVRSRAGRRARGTNGARSSARGRRHPGRELPERTRFLIRREGQGSGPLRHERREAEVEVEVRHRHD